jgi:hypothetical protein
MATPKGSLSAFEAKAKDNRHNKCWWNVHDLTDEQRADLNVAFAAGHITHEVIRLVLKDWGYEVAATSVSRHRKGECSCLAT